MHACMPHPRSKRKLVSLTSSTKSLLQKKKQTTSIASLPTEILSQIFSFISNQRDLHNLCEVCISFNQTATRFLYRWPKFRDTFSWAQFILSLTQPQSLGSLVQILDVSAIIPTISLSSPQRIVPIIKPTFATKIQVKLIVKNTSENEAETTTPTTNTAGQGRTISVDHYSPDTDDDEDDGESEITAEVLAVLAAMNASNNSGNVNNAPGQQLSAFQLLIRQEAAALASNVNNHHNHIQQTYRIRIPTPPPPPPFIMQPSQHWLGNNHQAIFQQHLHRAPETEVSSFLSEMELFPQILISASSLKDLAERCPDLLVLNLANSTIFPDTYLPQINAYMSRLAYQPGDHLIRVPISVFDAIKALILGCKKLLSLDLRDNHEITEEIVVWIVQNAKCLRALNLGRCSKIKTMAARLFFVSAAPLLKSQVIKALT